MRKNDDQALMMMENQVRCAEKYFETKLFTLEEQQALIRSFLLTRHGRGDTTPADFVHLRRVARFAEDARAMSIAIDATVGGLVGIDIDEPTGHVVFDVEDFE